MRKVNNKKNSNTKKRVSNTKFFFKRLVAITEIRCKIIEKSDMIFEQKNLLKIKQVKTTVYCAAVSSQLVLGLVKLVPFNGVQQFSTESQSFAFQ